MVYPVPGRGNRSTIVKINPGEKSIQASKLSEVGKKAIQSSKLSEVGKKIISCQNTSRAPISVFIKYREEHTGKERLETFPLHSACGPGSLTRDHTLGLEVK